MTAEENALPARAAATALETDVTALSCPESGLPDLALVTESDAGTGEITRTYLRATVNGEVTHVPATIETLRLVAEGPALPSRAAWYFKQMYAALCLPQQFARLTTGLNSPLAKEVFALPDRDKDIALHREPVLQRVTVGSECQWAWIYHHPTTGTGAGAARGYRRVILARARWDDLDGIAALIEMGTRPDDLRALAWMLAHNPEQGTR